MTGPSWCVETKQLCSGLHASMINSSIDFHLYNLLYKEGIRSLSVVLMSFVRIFERHHSRILIMNVIQCMKLPNDSKFNSIYAINSIASYLVDLQLSCSICRFTIVYLYTFPIPLLAHQSMEREHHILDICVSFK